MSFATKTYTGDGSTTDFAITIDYLDRTHISVAVDNVLTTAVGAAYDFTFVNDTTVRIQKVSDSSAVDTGLSIKIIRQTPIDSPAVVFGGGVSLSSENLNRNSEYLTFALQEATDANDGFTKKYLGAKAANPTLDNEGEALEEGAMYLNTTDSRFYGYTGGVWVAAGGATGASGNDGADGADGADGVGTPIGGSTGEILAKASNSDYDFEWQARPVDGVDGADGANGSDGADGEGVPTGGSTGQILSKVNGTDYNTQWVDPGAGSRVLLSRTDFSGDTEFDISLDDGSTYVGYEVVLVNAVPTNDTQSLRLRTLTGGSLDFGGSDYAYLAEGRTLAASPADVQNSDNLSGWTILCAGVGSTGAGESGVTGTVRILGHYLAANQQITFEGSYVNSTGDGVKAQALVNTNFQNAIDGIRLYWSVGNFESGFALVYGIPG